MGIRNPNYGVPYHESCSCRFGIKDAGYRLDKNGYWVHAKCGNPSSKVLEKIHLGEIEPQLK